MVGTHSSSLYTYEIEFHATTQHGNTDGLSCVPLVEALTQVSSDEPSVFNISQLASLPVTAAKVQQASRTDPDIAKVLRYTQFVWPSDVERDRHPYWMRRYEFTVQEGCLLWGIRVVIPSKLQTELLAELHQEHP